VVLDISFEAMRPSLSRLVRIIPRSALGPTEGQRPHIIPEPVPQNKENKVSIIQILMEQQETMGSKWPTNLRLEPVVTKETFARVKADYRKDMKRMLTEK